MRCVMKMVSIIVVSFMLLSSCSNKNRDKLFEEYNTYFSAENYTEALKVSDEILKHYPKNIPNINNRIVIFLLEGRLDEAISCLHLGMKNNPELVNSISYNSLGVFYLIKGEMSLSDKYFNIATSYFEKQLVKSSKEDSTKNISNYIMHLYCKGSFEEAEELFKNNKNIYSKEQLPHFVDFFDSIKKNRITVLKESYGINN